MECPATHEYCEYGYPGAPADHVACTAALEQASLYKRYVTPDSGVQSQSVIDACEASPCLNGGTCSATGASTFSCTCPEPFTGATCETVTNYCLVGKCLNGATCTFLPTTAPYFDCTCAPGFNGTLCENAYFKCPGSGSQGDPEKCYRYFVCSGVNGLFTRKTCPKLGIDQFLFDTTTKLCKSSTKSPVTIAGCSNT
ncbi:hypothetical protein DFJ74DRAFT_697837 [Hyaloraphidium curvatum]|nr:hypothetical protein DFJ74DRAFT_697837 [Hyaloraphidium curvatum]